MSCLLKFTKHNVVFWVLIFACKLSGNGAAAPGAAKPPRWTEYSICGNQHLLLERTRFMGSNSLLPLTIMATGLCAYAGCAPLEPLSSGVEVHEWGTFTSVADWQGNALEGLHRTEEPLPKFVHGRDPAKYGQKGVESSPSGVTQKLETPVIYFYSGETVSMHAAVQFPHGIISEWFPSASGFTPSVGQLAFPMKLGTMEWDAEVIPGLSAFPEVSVGSPGTELEFAL